MTRKSWRDFQLCGLLWWVNRTLHLFGWTIVLSEAEDGSVTAFPARTSYRGFDEKTEEHGFKTLTANLFADAHTLLAEVHGGEERGESDEA